MARKSLADMIQKKEGFMGERVIVMPPQVIKQYANENLVGPCYVTDIGYYPKASHHHRNRKNGAKEHILIYCVEGRGYASIDGHKFAVAPNQFIILPAGTPHGYGADENEPWTIYWVHFYGSYATVICDRLYKKMLEGDRHVMLDNQQISLFDKMYCTLQDGYRPENIEFIALSLPYYLSSFLLGHVSHLGGLEQRNPKDPCDLVIAFLKDRIPEPLTLQEISDHVCLSTSHFSKIFQKKTGYSPIEYFNHLKIQHACQLLQFTELRIYEIAFAIGITDPLYFSRLFSSHMGASPRQYRKRWVRTSAGE